MKQKQKTIECFVPAMALQNDANGEFFTFRDKLCAAVARYSFNGDFKAIDNDEDGLPFVFPVKTKLRYDPLGYQVVAKIRA